MDHFTDYMEEKMRTLMEQSHIIVDDLDAFVESYHGPVEKLYVTFPNRAEYEKAYEAVRKLPVFLTDGGWAVDIFTTLCIKLMHLIFFPPKLLSF